MCKKLVRIFLAYGKLVRTIFVFLFFVSAESVLTQTKRTRKLFEDCVWSCTFLTSAKIQPFSAQIQPKFSHFSHFGRIWLEMAEFGWNSAKWLEFSQIPATSSHFWPDLWKWLNLAEKDWIFGRVKRGRFGWKWWGSWLERARKTQPTPIKINSHSQPNPFLAWWLYLSRG